MTANSTTSSFLKRIAIAVSISVMIVFVACAAEQTDPPIIVTRWVALLLGTLVEEDGCLRVVSPDRPDATGTALVWQKDILEVTRSGDEITIIDLYGDNGQPDGPVIWRLGDSIRAGGGELRIVGVIEHAGADFVERCSGPYWLVSGV